VNTSDDVPVSDGAPYVFAVTVFCASPGGIADQNDHQYFPAAFFDSPSFTIRPSSAGDRLTMGTDVAASASETMEDLLAEYETIRARTAAAQLAAVRHTLHQASRENLLTNMLGADSTAGRPTTTAASSDNSRGTGAAAATTSAAGKVVKLDLLTEDVLEMVSDGAATSCLEFNWYSPQGALVPDPTVHLMRRLHETSVLESALHCILRHNDAAETAAQSGGEESPGGAQLNDKTSCGNPDAMGVSEDENQNAVEGHPAADRVTTGVQAQPSQPTPPDFSSPSYLRDRLLQASAARTHTSTLAGLFFSPASSSSALERQFFSDLLHVTHEQTARVAFKLRTARRQPLSPAYDFFSEVMADVKSSHRGLCRAFLLSGELPELRGLNKAIEYLHTGRHWVFSGSEIGIGDAPDRAGRVRTGESQQGESSEGRTDQELTAESVSSELDDVADSPSTPSAPTGSSRGAGGDRKKRRDGVTVRSAPIGDDSRVSTARGDDREPTEAGFLALVERSGGSSTAAVELLSLLADRVCSGAHTEAAQAHRRAEKIRRALRQQVDSTEAAARAAMKASFALFGGRRAVRKIVRSVKKELQDEEEEDENSAQDRSSSRRVASKRKERETAADSEDNLQSKSRRGRANGEKQSRRAPTSSGRGRMASVRVPVHGLIAAGAYKVDPEASVSTDEDSSSADSDGSLRSVSGEEDGSESVDEMEVEVE
jgi:hypothetical protein